MLRSINSLIGYTVIATDGEIGKVEDLYFDDKIWSTAYAVVRMSDEIGGRRVFLPPTALGKPDWEREEFPVVYSKKQVMNSPDFSISGASAPFLMPDPEVGLGIMLLANSGTADEQLPREPSLDDEDPHLQSANAVMRYRIRAVDGKMGRIRDVVVDDSTWAICFLVAGISLWLPGRKVLIEPRSITTINRTEEQVYIHLTVGGLKAGPHYDRPMPVSREYESRLQEYYETRRDHHTGSGDEFEIPLGLNMKGSS